MENLFVGFTLHEIIDLANNCECQINAMEEEEKDNPGSCSDLYVKEAGTYHAFLTMARIMAEQG